ncbi:MAG: hypothetical protein LLF94_09240 [Chlamydiales bacterium]|nr:hypothetical protein [Chlamydiales bacterium]
MRYNFLLCLCLILGISSACNHSDSYQNSDLTYADFTPGTGYTIQMPNGWHEVANYRDVKKHIFWSFSNSNYTKFTEEPLFRAWDGPENLHSFFTVSEVKRHCHLSVSSLYDDLIRTLKDRGWVMHEAGVSEIDNKRTKWWVQSVPEGSLHQKCYLVAHENKMYVFAFTTSYLSEDKLKLYNNIAYSITFKKAS